MSQYQYTEEDYNNIRQSLAYRNVITALNNVFGDTWSLQELQTDRPPDFTIRIAVGPLDSIAYVYAIDTHTTGMYARGPGGRIGVSVPSSANSEYRSFDGQRAASVEHLVGTPDEQKRYEWGVGGVNIPKIEEYLQLLQRYLTTSKWRLFGCAKLRQVANSLRKTSP